MSFLPGHFPGGALGGFRPAEVTFAGSIANFTNGNTKDISCTYGPEHASRYAYCVIALGLNANSSLTGNVSSVSFDGNAATQIYLSQVLQGHASVYGVALPSGASGTCSVTRSIGNGFGTLLASCFTVNYLRDPLTMIDKADYIANPQDDPWSITLQTVKGGVILFSVRGPGPNAAAQVTTSTPGVVIDSHIFGASPNTQEVCSAHYDNTPTNSALSLSFDALGGGDQDGTAISLR